MVIDDLDVIGVAVAPHKADSPLVIDPDAVLTLSVAVQGLQPVA